MKKSRWHKYFAMKDTIAKEFTPEEVEELEGKKECDCKDDCEFVLPTEILEALKDGIYDGKFKKANQKKLAEYFQVELKSRKDGKAKA